MPELPEVEVARRNVERWCVGKSVVSVGLDDPDAVTAGDLRDLEGAPISASRRRGKFLLLESEGAGQRAIVHFRMTGKLVAIDPESESRKVRASLTMDDGTCLAFIDTRRLGHIDVVSMDGSPEQDLLEEMGPEPWPEALGGETLGELLSGTRQAVKVALMDQRRVAGIGNILASEVCHAAGVNPRTPCNKLGADQLEALSSAITTVIDKVLDAEDGDEIHYINDGAPDEVSYFDVYKREGEPCRTCGGAVERDKQSGRSTFWCPSCQGDA